MFRTPCVYVGYGLGAVCRASTQFSLELVELDGLDVSPLALIQDNGMPCLLAVRLDLVAIQMKNCSACPPAPFLLSL